MPELPEVETTARTLRGRLVGRIITGAEVRWPRTAATHAPPDLAQAVTGRRIQDVGRRGKYVVFTLDQGSLLVHLKMTGRLFVVPADSPQDQYVRAWFNLDDGHQLRFHDVRKFGRVYLVGDTEEVTAPLGPEPLGDELTVAAFRSLLERRRGRLKPLLLNQTFLAGLGNIYADEALHRAGLHPLRTADSLSLSEQERLYMAIRTVLAGAVQARGTTLSDGGYLDAEGRPGGFQTQVAVYGRAGERCPRCGGAIQRIVLGQRSTHFCPRCQPEG
jgi:formamidopyrimidine-DNA glycosylase